MSNKMLILMNHVRQPNDPLTENIIHFIKKKKNHEGTQ